MTQDVCHKRDLEGGGVEMIYLILRGKMAKRNITIRAVADLLNIHRNSIYGKFNDGRALFQNEDRRCLYGVSKTSNEINRINGDGIPGGNAAECISDKGADIRPEDDSGEEEKPDHF